MIDWSLIEKLYNSNTYDNVFKIVKLWADKNGFEGFGVAARFSRVIEASETPHLIRRHNYETDLSKLYAALEDPVNDQHDPVVQASIHGVPTLSYDSSFNTNIPYLLDLIPASRKQILFASECGVRSGVISPFKLKHAKWGFLNLSSSCKFTKGELDYLVASASHFSQAVASTLERTLFDSHPIAVLSGRERDVIRWAAIGKTSWEISMILKISERTVNFHLTTAAKKLGVKGRRAACTVAMVQGLIQLA
jgi:DNA-binding CsgD family transcriptional regulator